MFPETLNKPLPQTVAEAEKMSMIRIRIGKPRSTNTDGTEREDQ
ncbi:unnamed protein product, partial [Rotaria socialis]